MEQTLCGNTASQGHRLLRNRGKMREKMEDLPMESSSSWPILENQGAILLKIP